jgi:hypothetical protein
MQKAVNDVLQSGMFLNKQYCTGCSNRAQS